MQKQKYKQFTIIATFPIEQVDSFAEYYGISEDIDNAIVEITKQNLINFLGEPFKQKVRNEIRRELQKQIKVKEIETENLIKEEYNLIENNSKNALEIKVTDFEIEVPIVDKEENLIIEGDI
jgi:hypothetical protein